MILSSRLAAAYSSACFMSSSSSSGYSAKVLLYPLTILAGLDFTDPFLVVSVPADCFFLAFREIDALLPVEFLF
jgi:hypothetical protein